MKTLTKLILSTMFLLTACAAQAQVARGYSRSNGTYALPYYRTPANGVPYDNLSYRGYSSQQPGYVYRKPVRGISVRERARLHADRRDVRSPVLPHVPK